MEQWKKAAVTWGLPLLKAVIILLVGHFIIVYLLKWVKKAFDKSRLDLSLVKFLLKTISITGHTILVLSALNAVGVSTTGLLAALSAAAVGVALALKDSLSNIAGGILLLLAPRFSTGDFIKAGEESGTVLRVDLMHTTIRTLDYRQVLIPNGGLVNAQIVNYSREPFRRVDLVFPIAYETDPETAKQAALRAAEAHPLVQQTPEPPFARVDSYGDSAVNIVLRVWCAGNDYWTVHFDLLEQVRAAFDEAGVTIPFNQLDVHLKTELPSPASPPEQ